MVLMVQKWGLSAQEKGANCLHLCETMGNCIIFPKNLERKRAQIKNKNKKQKKLILKITVAIWNSGDKNIGWSILFYFLHLKTPFLLRHGRASKSVVCELASASRNTCSNGNPWPRPQASKSLRVHALLWVYARVCVWGRGLRWAYNKQHWWFLWALKLIILGPWFSKWLHSYWYPGIHQDFFHRESRQEYL